MIHCPNCGEIPKQNVKPYCESLKKQQIGISPLLPTCCSCGAEVAISRKASGGNIIVLNGTCGSGKTAIAEWFAGQGWLAIDGDCAIQSLHHKTGRKHYEWSELIDEIADEIDILSLFGDSIVLAHVILPGDLDRYAEMIARRNLLCKWILLKPEYQTAVARCRTRTCHEKSTPEEWIRHFYDALDFSERFVIVDNTLLSIRETAEEIAAMPYYR